MNIEIQNLIKTLEDLQLLDRDLISFEKKLAGNPQKVEGIREKNRKQREKIEDEKAQLKQLEQEQHTKEGDLKFREDKSKRIEARIRAVRSGKEYQALLRETALAKKENSELEEEILRAWEEIEQLKVQITSHEENLLQGERADQEEIERLQGELEGLDQRIAELREHRHEIIKDLGNDILQRYQRIRDRVSWDVVTKVKAGICQGCHVNLPPQLFNQILRCDEIHQCPNCHRILFHDGGKQDEQAS